MTPISCHAAVAGGVFLSAFETNWTLSAGVCRLHLTRVDRPIVLRKIRAFIALGLCVVPVLGSAVARAAESDNPENLIRVGNDLRRKGDDLRAFGYLQRAFELSGTPRAAAQLGLVEQALGRFADSESHLTLCLSSNDAWVDANRKNLDASRASGRKHLGQVKVTEVPAGTTVAVGERPPERLRPDATLWLAPGSVTLVFEAPGFRRSSKTVVPKEGATITVAADLVSERSVTATGSASGDTTGAGTGTAVAAGGTTAAVARTAPTGPDGVSATSVTASPTGQDAPDPGASWRITGLAIGGAGVGLGVAGFVLLRIGSNKLGAIESDANATPPRPYNAANGNYQTFQTSGVVLLAAGGAAIVTGAALYLLNREPSGATSAASAPGRANLARRAPSLVPTLFFSPVSTEGARVGVLGRF